MNVTFRKKLLSPPRLRRRRDCPSAARLPNFSLLYLPPSGTQAIHGATHGFIGKSHEGIHHEPF